MTYTYEWHNIYMYEWQCMYTCMAIYVYNEWHDIHMYVYMYGNFSSAITSK